MALPLDGVRILDLTRALAGPFCTMILADLGADVIKVEPAGEGDMIRAWQPFDRGIGVYFLSVNRNKRSLAINLRDADGLAVVREMASKAECGAATYAIWEGSLSVGANETYSAI